MSPRPGGDVSNSSEFAIMGSGEFKRPAGDWNALAVAIRFLREHTGQAILLIYLAISVISRLDDVWFYKRFRVNILSYSDPQDFLLAPMRNPVTLFFFVIPAAILIVISLVVNSRKRAPRMPSRWNTPQIRLVAGASLAILASAILTKAHADRRADRVRAGEGRHVSFTRNDGVSYGEQPLLLGSTGQFFFLYYANRRVAEIVPVENTALMTVDLHRKNDPGTAVPTVGGAGNSPRLSP